MQQLACRRLFVAAACMQVACSLPYASSVAASIEIHVHIPSVQGVDALHSGVDALHTGVNALHAGCKQAACRVSTPRKYAVNEHAHSWCIFLFLAYDSIL